ncbi:cell division protein ZapB [Treponema sp. R80B11-R83G3]
MISLEQVQLLETKVAKAIEYVQRVNSENAALLSERAGLQQKLDANQKRLDELELLVMRFKEDQGRIEDGIVAALDRLSQFEEAFEKSLKEKTTTKKAQAKKEKTTDTEPKEAESDSKEFFEISAKEAKKNAELSSAVKETSVQKDKSTPKDSGTPKNNSEPADNDSADNDSADSDPADTDPADSDSADKELDIF